MKEKKLSWLERYEARQREQVTHSSEILFTPGVPTEDGWYVCRTVNGYEVVNKFVYVDINPDYVLSHAKLPEL